jgi:hypothetical protein
LSSVGETTEAFSGTNGNASIESRFVVDSTSVSLPNALRTSPETVAVKVYKQTFVARFRVAETRECAPRREQGFKVRWSESG